MRVRELIAEVGYEVDEQSVREVERSFERTTEQLEDLEKRAEEVSKSFVQVMAKMTKDTVSLLATHADKVLSLVDVYEELRFATKGIAPSLGFGRFGVWEWPKQMAEGIAQQGSMLTDTLTAPISKAFAALTTGASDAEEILNKFSTVFKPLGEGAHKMANSFSKNFGISRIQARNLTGNTGDLLIGMGMAADQAFDLSLKVGRLGIDLASFTNYSGGAEGAVHALTKALLGEREMAKMLGLVLREDLIKAKMKALKASGKLGHGISELSLKALATYQLAVDQSQNAIGDYAKTSDSYANMLRRVYNKIKDVVASFGVHLLPKAKASLTVFEALVDSVLNLNEQTKKSMVQVASAAAGVGPAIWAAGKALKVAFSISSLVFLVQILQVIFKYTKHLLPPALRTFGKLLRFVGGWILGAIIWPMLKWGVITAAFVGLLAALEDLYRFVKGQGSLTEEIFGGKFKDTPFGQWWEERKRKRAEKEKYGMEVPTSGDEKGRVRIPKNITYEEYLAIKSRSSPKHSKLLRELLKKRYPVGADYPARFQMTDNTYPALGISGDMSQKAHDEVAKIIKRAREKYSSKDFEYMSVPVSVANAWMQNVPQDRLMRYMQMTGGYGDERKETLQRQKLLAPRLRHLESKAQREWDYSEQRRKALERGSITKAQAERLFPVIGHAARRELADFKREIYYNKNVELNQQGHPMSRRPDVTINAPITVNASEGMNEEHLSQIIQREMRNNVFKELGIYNEKNYSPVEY